jgi:hypothetical protein
MNLIVGFMLVMAFTRVLGPFVYTPIVVTASLLAMTANPSMYKRPLVLAGWLLAVIAVPQVLEWAGVFASTWSTVDGGVCSTSAILKGRSDLDAFELLVGNAVLLGAVAAFALRSNRAMTEASHQVHIQAWHLNQLLPARA